MLLSVIIITLVDMRQEKERRGVSLRTVLSLLFSFIKGTVKQYPKLRIGDTCGGRKLNCRQLSWAASVVDILQDNRGQVAFANLHDRRSQQTLKTHKTPTPYTRASPSSLNQLPKRPGQKLPGLHFPMWLSVSLMFPRNSLQIAFGLFFKIFS